MSRYAQRIEAKRWGVVKSQFTQINKIILTFLKYFITPYGIRTY
jgi:hypothetical protein